ncbi:uncharacterized protein LOC124917165 [Impatiens glandulifera]|uniref:uncharacterized protein LOC124917165 n=1 Tax=Impatiens glandulifera TaxID=253017 RepID=UPI001FB0ABFF|nr:uncharacterized protein LOC124917165 [Impatiens glandulifera]
MSETKTFDGNANNQSTTSGGGGGGGELSSFFLKSANDLSNLHAQTLKLNKLSFDAGHRHSLERFNEWLMMKMQQGIPITPTYVLAYLQEEINTRTTVCQESEPDLSPNNTAGHHQPRDDYEMDNDDG